MLTIPEIPYGLIALRPCPEGIELVGVWPEWTLFDVDSVMGMPLMENGELLGAPIWQGFGWDRHGGFIEVRVHDQSVRYLVIDVANRQLVCRLEGEPA